MKGENPIGNKYGRFIVIKEIERRNGNRYFLCECECGTLCDVAFGDLKNGHSKSCGCLMRELCKNRFTKHGHTANGEMPNLYSTWVSFKHRCNNPNAQHYNRYGGRGITVCEEWKDDFQTFYDWAMKNGYRHGLTIDREDNDSGYSPENCRWVTQKVNNNNRHQNNQYGKDNQA